MKKQEDKNLVQFPSSKAYLKEKELEKGITQKFTFVEGRLELMRKELEVIDSKQDKIQFYLDEIENFLP
jgi:hypothetical protein